MTGLMGRPALRVPAAVLALAVVVRVLVTAFGPGPAPVTSTIRLPRESAAGKFATCVGKARNIETLDMGDAVKHGKHIPGFIKIKRVTWTLDGRGLTAYFQMEGRIPKSSHGNHYSYGSYAGSGTSTDYTWFGAQLGPHGWKVLVEGPDLAGPDAEDVDIKPIINGNGLEVRMPPVVRLPNSGLHVHFGSATRVGAEVSISPPIGDSSGDGCPAPYSTADNPGGWMIPLGGK